MACWSESVLINHVSARTPQIVQASNYRPHKLSPGLALIPPYLFKIDASHAIAISGRYAVPWQAVCYLIVFAKRYRMATVEVCHLL